MQPSKHPKNQSPKPTPLKALSKAENKNIYKKCMTHILLYNKKRVYFKVKLNLYSFLSPTLKIPLVSKLLY